MKFFYPQILAMLITTSCNVLNIFAQEQVQHSWQSDSSDGVHRNTYIGYAFSPTLGYIGRQGVSLMHSVTIGRVLSSGLRLEGNVHIFGSSYRFGERPTQNNAQVRNIIMSDIQCLFSPFSEGILLPVSFGIGMVAVWQHILWGFPYPVDISDDYSTVFTLPGIYRIENWRLGGLLAAEYDIPLNSAVHLGIRAQWFPIWTKTFFEKDNTPQPSPRLQEWLQRNPYAQEQLIHVGSLGAFLRISF